MDVERGRRLRDLVRRLESLPPETRRAHVESHVTDRSLGRDALALLGELSPTESNATDSDPRAGTPWPVPDTVGDYVVEDTDRPIGQGAMGLVLRARHAPTDRRVALKILHPHLTDRESVRARFLTEGKLLKQVRHPHIVAVHDVGESDGLVFVAMDLVDGGTLGDRLAHLRATGSVETAFDDGYLVDTMILIAQAARALHHVHAEFGVIHRDIKPSNVLIDTTGNALIADFGIARVDRAADLFSHDLARTRTEEMLGTPSYMSPEQWTGRTPTHQSDVFSLGAVMYECLTLTPPFAAPTSAETMGRTLHAPLEPVRKRNPRVSVPLARICERALARRLDCRYPTSERMASDLDAVCGGARVSPWRPPFRASAREWVARRRRPLAIAAAIVLVFSMGAAAFLRGPDAATTGRALIAAGFPLREILATPTDIGGNPTGEARRVELDGPAVLEAGAWRVSLLGDEGRAELTTFVRAGHTDTLRVDMGPDPMSTAGMVLIDTSLDRDEHLSATTPVDSAYVAETSNLAAFWIDAYETSNEDYRAFAVATDRPSPALWPETLPADWEDLPVVGLTVADAQAYCMWRGKRLPTALEWERAARGPLGFVQPWGNDPILPYDLANVGHDDSRAWSAATDDARLRYAYTEHVLPVRELRGLGDVTPTGVHHLAGNVSELTVSMRLGDAGEARYQSRIVKGGHWGRDPDEGAWVLANFVEIELSYRLLGTGCRCVRTAN